jgi:hypothetical protein
VIGKLGIPEPNRFAGFGLAGRVLVDVTETRESGLVQDLSPTAVF